MVAPAVPVTSIQIGAGVLLKAPIGTAGPTSGGTVAGSVFTDSWPAGWNPIGATEGGHDFSYQIATGTVEVAEYLVPLKIVSTGVTVGVSFAISEMTAKNYTWVLNGGTYTLVSGTGATTLSKVSPPALGAEVRTMLGWESSDGTERIIWYQCLQSGNIQIPRHKGADNANLPVAFSVEQPSSGNPFDIWIAGATRVGV
jgi:hypothetical protein